MKKQAGFTIVELVVVIALLGILAAVALPRFLNVTDDAHAASVNGTGGALRSAVALVKAQAVVEQVASNDIDFDDDDAAETYVNAGGFPQGGDAVSAANCLLVWTDVLQAGAPSVNVNANQADYQVTLPNNTTCRYTYQAANTMFIEYVPSTGVVSITANP